jgi:hypothetical protein
MPSASERIRAVNRWSTILLATMAVGAIDPVGAEEFRFTDFSVSNDVLRFDATWPAEDPPPGGIVDLYCRTNLAHGAARILHTETNAVAPLSFAIGEDIVPAGGAAFFRLGSRVDADGDAMPDAWELGNGLDPGDPADSVRDDDGDGLANLHEFWHGTDPHAADGADTALAVLAHSVDSRIAGKSPATALPYFLGYPALVSGPQTNALASNPDCWAADVDFSCESPWNDEAKNRKSGTLVSPIHMLLANHHNPPDPGTNFWFRAPDGSVHVRSIQAKRRIVSTPDTDLVVALLDEPLPPTIAPAKILPENFREHLGSGLGLPAVSLDQEGKILVSEIVELAVEEEDGWPSWAESRVPLDPTRAAFYELLVAGDSSNPKFLLLEDQPILLSIHWMENHAGASIRRYADLVDAAMTNLSPHLGYRLETVDLDRFRKLPSMPR